MEFIPTAAHGPINTLLTYGDLLQERINNALEGHSPLKIVVITAGTAYSIAWLQNNLNDGELSKKWIFQTILIIADSQTILL